MMRLYSLIVLLTGAKAAGIGEAWQITPNAKSVYADHPFRPRLDSSAFEIRTISGIGRLARLDESQNVQKRPEFTTPCSLKPNTILNSEETSSEKENKNLERLRKILENSSYNDDESEEDIVPMKKILKDTMRILHANKDNDNDDDDDDDERDTNETRGIVQRIRRQAKNETSMEKITTTKSVREARQNTPETWSSSVQPLSVEIRHRIPLDQVIQQRQQEEEEAAALANSYRRHQAPRADFVTTGQHHRRSYSDYRESRDMPITKSYDDYDQMSWYRNAIRERDYEYPMYRRGYSYQYPDRYRADRDYYMRMPNDHYYYDRHDRYDRNYREDDLDLYGRNRPTPKPRRIIYYATLPEIERKPVDLRNYPRYGASSGTISKTSVTRDGTYKRVPGNIDPGRYRYRQSYYDPYAKRSSYYDRPYGYPDDDSRRVRVSTKETLRNDGYGASNERKVSNLVAIRDDDGKVPWPVQIGTEVSIKDDERIPGRKIYESNGGYERFQSAQLQKASDATGSSELQSGN